MSKMSINYNVSNELKKNDILPQFKELKSRKSRICLITISVK